MWRSGFTQRFDGEIVAMTTARAAKQWGPFVRNGAAPHNGYRPPDVNDVRIIGLGGHWWTGPATYKTYGPWKAGIARGCTSEDPKCQYHLGNYSGVHPAFPGDEDLVHFGSFTSGQVIRTPVTRGHGGWSVIEGSCTGTKLHRRRFLADLDGASGAAAALVVADSSANGKLWRMVTAPENNVTVTTDPATFTITAPG